MWISKCLDSQETECLARKFDRKAEEEGFDSESSDEADESLTVPQRPNEYEVYDILF